MPTRTEGQAENYMNKLHDAIERGGSKYFLSTNLGELSHFAPKEEHPDKRRRGGGWLQAGDSQVAFARLCIACIIWSINRSAERRA